MRVRVQSVHYGGGFLAAAADEEGPVVQGFGFDEVLVEFASKRPDLCPADGSPLRLGDLNIAIVDKRYGQYLLEVTRR